MKLLFGTAGVPISASKRDSITGIKQVRELGLDAMELEFVQGVRMGKELAEKVREAAEENKIALSVHAPYFINLNSKEKEKLEASKKRIIDSAIIGSIAGAKNIVFHPAYYGKDNKANVYERVKKAMQEILEELEREGVKEKIILRPETTGKATQFGSLEEIINLSIELENTLPCVDFSHIHARFQRFNSYDEFCEILGKIESMLGKEALKDMHIHFSGIEYSRKGERRHLNLEESDFKYRELLKALKDFDVAGLAISESPNIEGDAILMKKEYEKI